MGSGVQGGRSEVSKGFGETEGQPREEIKGIESLGATKGNKKGVLTNISGTKESLRAAWPINK